jgi:exodeoxyribonuclease VII large subunit
VKAFFLPPGVLSVSQLTNQIKARLESTFSSVWVCGEVCDFKIPTSGHWYLSLRDKVDEQAAVLNAVMWASSNRRARFEPKNGMEVFARGQVTYYPPQGRLQMVVERLEPKGLGAKELALQQLKDKLLHKGYFAPQRKRRLPKFPRRIGLVTSPTGAAVRDILEVVGRRWRAAEVWICPVRVQGETAATEITASLALLNRLAAVDVVILGRGGGSAEDLSAFNEERVADAIFRSRVPVVSAVGHEIDVTIADLVADVRALTPSEAAELVVPDGGELLKGLADTQVRLGQLLWGRLDLARQRLSRLGDCRVFRRPLDRVHDLQQRLDALDERLQRAGKRCFDLHQRLDALDERLQRAGKRRLERLHQALEGAAGRLQSLSPLNVLGRGYSLTRRADDRQVIRSSGQVRPGDVLETTVQHGKITSRAEEIAADV